MALEGALYTPDFLERGVCEEATRETLDDRPTRLPRMPF
jgi:hypothetical protein